MFRQSSHLHFHLPFNDVQYQDRIEIDCEYVESLSLVQGYYYLRIPLFFFDGELKSSTLEEEENTMLQNKTATDETNFERRVKIHCRVNHANSMKVGVTCCCSFSCFEFFVLLYYCLRLSVNTCFCSKIMPCFLVIQDL